MKVELISNWQDERLASLITIETYPKLYRHFLAVLAKISRKPKTCVELAACMEPYASYLAIDAFMMGEVHKLHGYSPAPWVNERYTVELALQQDKEALVLMNQRFVEFQNGIQKNLSSDLMHMCASAYRSDTFWCAGGIRDTWRMAGYNTDMVICYSFGETEPDATCKQAWDMSHARKRFHFNIPQVLASEIAEVPKVARKKRVKATCNK